VAIRRLLLRGAALLSCLALAAFGGWAVRPYLPGPERPAAQPTDRPETTEDLVARLEELRAQKRELGRKEREFSQQVRSQQAEIDQQEAVVLSELKKREEDNNRRMSNLGHRTYTSVVHRP
jgi:TolA-binding protein